MRGLDMKADTYLDICQEFMMKEFGETAILNRDPVHKTMTARPASQDGSPVRCFEVSERVWMDMPEDFETHVVIVHDGKVSVSYPCQDIEHEGMNFHVDHPREVAELFHLLVYPASCISTSEETVWSKRKLGDLADFHVLIPDGTAWRILDLANPPAGIPAEFYEQVCFNVTQDWDKFCMGKTVEAHKMAVRWTDIIKILPAVDDRIKAGYVVSPDVSVKSAVDLIADGPNPRQIFLDLLLVPKGQELSCLCLRELLARDKEMGKALRKAFEKTNNHSSFHANLANVKVFMPVKRHHQIRIAAEHILVREWFRYLAGSLIDDRDICFLQ